MNSHVEPCATRVYVAVLTEFSPDGRMLPRVIRWTDGQKFRIERVTDIRPAASLKAGGQGDRYTVVIGGRKRYLFFERGCELKGDRLGAWFVEAARG